MESRSAQRPVPEISPAEWEVMKVLWDRGEGAARDVHAALEPEHGWAAKTVKTLLARLVAKGALDYAEVGNSYLYRPAVARDAVARREMDEFVERVLDGDAAPAIMGFVREAPLSPGDIEALRRLLDEKERAERRR